MSVFVPNNATCTFIPPASSVRDQEGHADKLYFNLPKDITKRSVSLDYAQLTDGGRTSPKKYVNTILTKTPKPKGRYAFSNVHIVGPSKDISAEAETTICTLVEGCKALKKDSFVHRLSYAACTNTCGTNNTDAPMLEYNTIFEAASSLLLEKADRASLLVFVGWEDHANDAYAAFIGMLPFRGIQVALITRNTNDRANWLRMTTPSGTFDVEGLNAARMGKFTLHQIFGPCPNRTISEPVQEWNPIDIGATLADTSENVVELPFKIGGLKLPMLTHNGSYDDAMECLSNILRARYPKGYTPIVSVGETCDALGYGQDLIDALGQQDSLLFAHKSGETYKRYDNYGTKELFAKINAARNSTAPPLIIALGGGVNGNCIGLIAGMTNVEFMELPTTPMHYNDAVTSAKKAFSLVVDDTILSKNILGAFYLPQLAFCVNECFLTISTANVYATVGESCKTMNMLGIANSVVGMNDFHNILGAQEFASDFTKILLEVDGFESLLEFINSPSTLRKKRAILALGKRIATIRSNNANSVEARKKLNDTKPNLRMTRVSSSMPSLADSKSGSESSSSDSEEEYDSDDANSTYESLLLERKELMESLRKSFHSLPVTTKESILSFLTVVNKEIVSAKAMFLAYSDPFEKYRALLFEYAHTLGHGVEAFANGLYLKAKRLGVEVPPEAIRLHGSCVGMAVLWAGEMSKDLGKLTGKGYTLHQSFPYLFNRHKGFTFGPLRDLCDELGVTRDEFCEGVLKVVRRDNKRGYCQCSDPSKSVDQLVTCRPGKMLASMDPNAEVRYLVEVDEEWQKNVLEKAFEGYFDRSVDLVNDSLVFVSTEPLRRNSHKSDCKVVAQHIREEVLKAYQTDL